MRLAGSPTRLWALLALAAAAVGLAAAAATAEAASRRYGLALAIILAPLFAAFVARVRPSLTISLGLCLSIFSGNWSNAGLHLPLDRVFIVSGVAVAVWRAVRERRPVVAAGMGPALWFLLLLVLYAIGSAIWAGTLTQHDPAFALLDRLGIIPFLLFATAPAAFPTSRDRRQLLGLLLAVSTYLAFTAVAEGVHATPLVFPRYILNPSLGLHADRARGPFLEAAANGLALYAALVVSVIAWRTWNSRRIRALALAVGLGSVLGIEFTLTRQAWLGAAVATVLTMLFVRSLRRWLVPTLAVGALAVGGAIAFVPNLHNQIVTRASAQKPEWDRLNSDRAALHMIAAKPLFGFGWGRFGVASQPYYTQASTYPLSSISTLHSVALSDAVELGLVGASLWLVALLLAIGGACLRRVPPDAEPWRIGLLAFALCWVVVSNFTPLGYTFSNDLLWLLAGVVFAAGLRPQGALVPAAAPEPLEPPAEPLDPFGPTPWPEEPPVPEPVPDPIPEPALAPALEQSIPDGKPLVSGQTMRHTPPPVPHGEGPARLLGPFGGESQRAGRAGGERMAEGRTTDTYLLVASSGGHLIELRELADEYPRSSRYWVTFDKPDARALLEGERVTYAYGPTNRSVRNLLRNAVLALGLIRRVRPAAIITTGAGVAVPFIYVGRLLGVRTIYVESLARIDHLSLSGKLVYPVVDRLFVQWPELDEPSGKSEYEGSILDLPHAGHA